MHILLLESDRRIAKMVTEQAELQAHTCTLAGNPREAVALIDSRTPDIVILEMSLFGHSGMEFLYEFRSYPDWRTIPVIVYTSLQLSEDVLHSEDWRLLQPLQLVYKPDVSAQQLLTQEVSALT